MAKTGNGWMDHSFASAPRHVESNRANDSAVPMGSDEKKSIAERALVSTEAYFRD